MAAIQVPEEFRKWIEADHKYTQMNANHNTADKPLEQDEIDALLAVMKNEAERQRKGQRWIKIIGGLHVSGFVLALVGICCWHWPSVGGLLAPLGMLSNYIAVRLDTKERKKAVEQLAHFEDMRIVGPMCDVLSFHDPAMSQLAEETLLILLPRMKASDSIVLTPVQRNSLYRVLQSKNVPLIHPVLKALEQIGDSKALPYVEKLAAGKYAASKDSGVRTAAVECLPFLRERIAQGEMAANLLRPAGISDTSDILLRPAVDSPLDFSEELLRASTHKP